MHRPIVQSLWIGSRLSLMERLSISSYLEHGHPFHLYTYEDVENIPAGAIVRDGREILPAEEIFCYRRGFGKGSVAAFSNCFRYKLLLERGGWWSDLDSICLQPLDFDGEHVVGYERHPQGDERLGTGLMKAPAGSPVMKFCWDASWQVDRSTVRWGQIGPALLNHAVRQVNVRVQTLEPAAFYPINYWQVWELVHQHEMPASCTAIHLWHSQWRASGLNPDAIFRPDCIYEKLKARFKMRPPLNARVGPGSWSVVKYEFKRFKTSLHGKTVGHAA
jgi:hypothetical protein